MSNVSMDVEVLVRYRIVNCCSEDDCMMYSPHKDEGLQLLVREMLDGDNIQGMATPMLGEIVDIREAKQ